MTRISRLFSRLVGIFVYVSVMALAGAAQTATSTRPAAASTDGYFLPAALFAIVLTSLGAAYFFWKKSKRAIEVSQYNYGTYAKSYKKNYSKHESLKRDGVDAVKEMEWLRKAKKSDTSSFPSTSLGTTMKPGIPPSLTTANAPDLDFDTKIFQEKMRKLQYAQLPINSFAELSPASLYEPLPLSNDPAVLDAIEQANDEYESDEGIREVALRILTAFRTRNSVDALSQIALYDLSSNLRSRAVTVLTDFDHESVFEAILLACADPTREVRAAAARGLFKLNFDRGNAWTRIIETNDEFRMSHAARAALEAGIVVKSLDRLVHEDRKIAYEAFCLVSLLIRSGETEAIFEALRTHRDERVKFALLHVLKVSNDERTLEELHQIQTDSELTTDVAEKVREAITGFESVAA